MPQHLNSLRIVFGLLLSISHLTLLLSTRPYKRPSTHVVATACSFSLCCTLLAALLVKVIDVDIDSSLKIAALYGFKDAFPLTVIILIFNFGVLLAVLGVAAQRAYTASRSA